MLTKKPCRNQHFWKTVTYIINNDKLSWWVLMGKVPTLIHRYRGPLSTSLRPGKKNQPLSLPGSRSHCHRPLPTGDMAGGRRRSPLVQFPRYLLRLSPLATPPGRRIYWSPYSPIHSSGSSPRRQWPSRPPGFPTQPWATHPCPYPVGSSISISTGIGGAV
jgi:hypothetical protein